MIVGAHDMAAAEPTLAKLRRNGFASTLSLLGEVVVSEAEADEFAQAYLDSIRRLTQDAKSWKPLGGDSERDWGVAPRVNISVKPSSLYSQFRPQAFEAGVAAAVERLRVICLEAVKHGASICLDMEHRELKNFTLAVYRKLLSDPDLAGWPEIDIFAH